jgi:hypothetical protein
VEAAVADAPADAFVSDAPVDAVVSDAPVDAVLADVPADVVGADAAVDPIAADTSADAVVPGAPVDVAAAAPVDGGDAVAAVAAGASTERDPHPASDAPIAPAAPHDALQAPTDVWSGTEPVERVTIAPDPHDDSAPPLPVAESEAGAESPVIERPGQSSATEPSASVQSLEIAAEGPAVPEGATLPLFSPAVVPGTIAEPEPAPQPPVADGDGASAIQDLPDQLPLFDGLARPAADPREDGA